MTESKLDFFILPTAVMENPILPKIEFQYRSLEGLIAHCTESLKRERDLLESLKDDEVSSLHSGKYEDYEISKNEDAVMSEYSWKMECLVRMENDFYHAILIMAYSYFESIITAMCKEVKLSVSNSIKTNIEAIVNSCNGNFTIETQEKVDYFCNNLREIRNLLVHNYNGAPLKNKLQDQLAIAERESQKKIGFSLVYLRGTTQRREMLEPFAIVVEPKYIHFVLENAYSILSELETIYLDHK
jgi:hypothetical protein